MAIRNTAGTVAGVKKRAVRRKASKPVPPKPSTPKQPAWPADSIERRAIEKLVPNTRNARRHSAEQIAQVAAAITQFGWTMPVLIDESSAIIAGHGRVLAAQSLGISEVPVIVARGWSEMQKRAYALADNKLTLNGEWDDEFLRAELEALRGTDLGIGITGFTDAELDELTAAALGNAGNGDPDGCPELKEDPVSRRGDLWVLGRHRLLCGDCTVADDVARLMDGKIAVLMATDPPYGVAYDNAERPNPGVAKPRVAKPRVANDDLVDGPAMQAFLESMLRAALPHMDKHSAFYFWHPMLTQGTYVAAAAAAGILIHRQIIWVKPGLLLGRGDYHWRHELCFYGWQTGNRPPFYGPRNQDTIWEVSPVGQLERKEMNHATPKPVGLWDKPIANHTKPGGILYEPFAGSGTQIIAAEMTGRACHAIEINPAYVDVSIQRWQNFTGESARLLGDGADFAAIAEQRKAQTNGDRHR